MSYSTLQVQYIYHFITVDDPCSFSLYFGQLRSVLFCSVLFHNVLSHFCMVQSCRASLDHATMLSLLSSRCSASTTHAPHSGSGSGSGSGGGSGTSSVRSLLLFYSQIVGDYPTLVAEYVAEGSYRAAIGKDRPLSFSLFSTVFSSVSFSL